MKIILIALCCSLAVASAQSNWQHPPEDIVYEHLSDGTIICRINCHRPLRQCPQITCPLPTRPRLNPECPINVCNEQTQHILFPTPDPNTFYQCIKRNARGNWEAIEMNCGCQTQFDYEQQVCVHPHQFRRQCNATPIPIPRPRSCSVNGSPPIQRPPAQQPIQPPFPPMWPPNQSPSTNPPWLPPPQFPPQQPIHPPMPTIQPPNQIPETNPPWLPPQFPPAQNPVTDPPATEPTTRCTCAPCTWWPCPPCDCDF